MPTRAGKNMRYAHFAANNMRKTRQRAKHAASIAYLFAQYAEMTSKICNVPDRKANSFTSNNCP